MPAYFIQRLGKRMYKNSNKRDPWVNGHGDCHTLPSVTIYMVQYPENWEKIHAKLADYGFILRNLEGKEHIAGYGYEPWHIRYAGSPEIAREIMSRPGMTLEVWLGAVNDPGLNVDYGASSLYTEEGLEEAAVQVK